MTGRRPHRPGGPLARMEGPLANAVCAAVVVLFTIAMTTAGVASRSTPPPPDSAACGHAIITGSLTTRVSPEPQYPLVTSTYSAVSSYDGNGITLQTMPGTAVYSPIPGRVVRAGQVEGKSFTDWVVIDSMAGIDASVVLGSLDAGSITVKPGDSVHAGQQIGAVASSGSGSGLWLEAWAGGDQFTGAHNINPLTWLKWNLPTVPAPATPGEECPAEPDAHGGLTVTGGGAIADTLRAGQQVLGTPYSWGGGDLTGPSYGVDDPDDPNGSGAHIRGFECSSLVRYMVYAGSNHAVVLPRTAQQQYDATKSHEVAMTALRPGDLLFWGADDSLYHVGMYVGSGTMFAAPTTGQTVKLEPVWGTPSHATRPQPIS